MRNRVRMGIRVLMTSVFLVPFVFFPRALAQNQRECMGAARNHCVNCSDGLGYFCTNNVNGPLQIGNCQLMANYNCVTYPNVDCGGAHSCVDGSYQGQCGLFMVCGPY